MKKQKIPILALITCIFLGFLLGFFAGRNLNRTPVRIQAISAATGTTAPVVLPSRADSDDSKYYSLVLACTMAE